MVDIFGVWRWLGQETRWAEGAISAAQASERDPVPELFPASMFIGAAIADPAGDHIGHGVDAMLRCDDGQVSYVVIRSGGIGGVGEQLRELPWQRVRVANEKIAVDLDAAAFAALATIDPQRWPERA